VTGLLETGNLPSATGDCNRGDLHQPYHLAVVFAPVRALVVRRGAPLALIAAAAAVSLLFAATPFLIPAVADRYGIRIGSVGLISTSQVFGFAAAAFIGGRRLRPSRRLLVGSAVAAVVVNAASALISVFELLLVLRLTAGVTAGLFTWLAWADAMRAEKSMRAIAAVGPVTVLVGAPLLAWIGSVGGDRAIYGLLALAPIPAAVIPVDIEGDAVAARRHFSPSRSNVVLLGALGLLTMAGSAFFVFMAAFAQTEVGLGEVALSVGFSLHALAGLIGIRLRRHPIWAWPWMIGITVSVLTIIALPDPITFFAGMVGWGLCFWVAVPRILNRVAEWSLVAEERVGDAQGIMALGRSVGPAFGSVLVGHGQFVGVGVFSTLGLTGAAGLVGAVERYRSGRDGPAA